MKNKTKLLLLKKLSQILLLVRCCFIILITCLLFYAIFQKITDRLFEMSFVAGLIIIPVSLLSDWLVLTIHQRIGKLREIEELKQKINWRPLEGCASNKKLARDIKQLAENAKGRMRHYCPTAKDNK